MIRFMKLMACIFLAVLLLFTALLLTIFIIYMVNDSFNDRDTILAGCIGFVGAVIGGFVTLIGVRATIQENRREEIEKKLPKRIINANKIIGQLHSALNSAKFNLRIIKGELFPRSSKLNKKDLINAHSRVCNKINGFIDKFLNDTVIDIGYEEYEFVINFSNEFEKTKQQLEDTLSDFDFLKEGENFEKIQKEIKNSTESYISLINKLKKEIENEKKTNIDLYKKSKIVD